MFSMLWLFGFDYATLVLISWRLFTDYFIIVEKSKIVKAWSISSCFSVRVIYILGKLEIYPKIKAVKYCNSFLSIFWIRGLNFVFEDGENMSSMRTWLVPKF